MYYRWAQSSVDLFRNGGTLGLGSLAGGVQSVLRCVLAHAGDHRAKWLGTGTRMSRVRLVTIIPYHTIIFSGAEPPIFSNF